MERHRNQEDRELAREIDQSLRVSSYLGDVAEAIQQGGPVAKNIVPNYSQGVEPEPHHMNMNSLFANAISAIGKDGMEYALGDVHAPRQGDQTTFENSPVQKTASQAPGLRVSQNQKRALQKFPALIEMLGQEDFGEKIAMTIAEKVREITVEKIQKNTQSVNKHAVLCTAKSQNIKMYFKGEDWVCCVTASGPFRGDEIVQYNKDSDKHYILRVANQSIDDVTDDFNVIHEMNDKIEENQNEVVD